MRAAILFLLACASDTAFAAEPPRACLSPSVDRSIPYLPDGDPKVIAEDVTIDDRGMPPAYLMRTYSETDPSGSSRSEQCFRYEVENLDTRNVRNFFWPLAGFLVDPLEPKMRRSKKKKQMIMEDPIAINSKINAFENSEGFTRAWASRGPQNAQIQLNGTKGSISDGVRFVSIGRIDAQLPSALAGFGAISTVIGAYTFSQSDQQAPVTEDLYTASNFVIQVNSVADRSDNVLRFRTYVYASGDGVADADLFMPGLQALGRTRSSETKIRQVEEFLGFYKDMRSRSVSRDGKWIFSATSPWGDAAQAFVVQTPILIRRGAARECVMVTALAPIPVSFPLNECNGIGKGN